MRRTLVLALVCINLPAYARAEDPEPVLSYALSKTRVSAAVGQMITKCPPPASVQMSQRISYDLAFDYTILIEGKAVPSRLVRINPSSGFLVDRTTKMTFNEDGLTLKEYNATATGQGGPVIVGLIKSAAAVYGLTANPLAPAAVLTPAPGRRPGRPVHGDENEPEPVVVTRYYMVCHDSVGQDLAQLKIVKDNIDALEARLISTTLTQDQVDLLARLRAEATEIESRLTITTKSDAVIEPALSAAGPAGTMRALIRPADYSRWFEVIREARTLDPRKVHERRNLESDSRFTVEERLAALPRMIRNPDGSTASGPMAGLFGYEVTTKLDAKLLRWFSCGPNTVEETCRTDDVPTRTETADLVSDKKGLIYQRPVSGLVSVEPLDQPCAQAGACSVAFADGPGKPHWQGRDQASKSGAVKFQQLSRLFVLPTGGSIFGSRTVGATFDASGTPTMLQFDKGGGGKDAASILDASVAAAQSASGARLAATKARIDEIESAQKLHDLLEPDLDGTK